MYNYEINSEAPPPIYSDIFILPPPSYKDIFPREFRTYSGGNPDIDEEGQWRRNGGGGGGAVDDGLCRCENSTTRLVSYREPFKCNPWVCLKASFFMVFIVLLIGFGLLKMYEVI